MGVLKIPKNPSYLQADASVLPANGRPIGKIHHQSPPESQHFWLHPASDAAGFDQGLLGVAGEVETQASERCEVLGPVSFADAGSIFTEVDVEHPVVLILRAPVSAHGLGFGTHFATKSAAAVVFQTSPPIQSKDLREL